MKDIKVLHQIVQDRIQEEYNEGGSITQDIVHDIAWEEFAEMGGPDAFSDDEEEAMDMLVYDVIGNLTITF